MNTLSTRSRFWNGAVALLFVAVSFGCSGQQEAAPPASTAAEAPIPATASPYDALPPAVRDTLGKPFTGDLDEMVKRRAIRAAVTFNRTHYFIDNGQERGLAYESLKAFENDLNTGLKTGNLKVHVVLVPMTARPTVSRACQRPGRHGRGHGHGHARTGETRRLFGADPYQREPGRGHRPRSAADRLG